MKEKESVDALKLVHTLFSKHSIPYWLDKGTLLGAVRDKQLIPWDDDVDIAIPFRYQKDIHSITSAFDETPFELYYVNGHFCLRLRETGEHIMCILPYLVYKPPLETIFVEFLPPLTWIIDAVLSVDYSRQEDYIETVSRIKQPKFFKKSIVWLARKCSASTRHKIVQFLLRCTPYKSTKWVEPPVPFSTCTIYDTSFTIPQFYENYLTGMFGDWKTPKHKGIPLTTQEIKEYENKK